MHMVIKVLTHNPLELETVTSFTTAKALFQGQKINNNNNISNNNNNNDNNKQ